MNYQNITFNLIRKPIKNIHLRIAHDGSVNVSAPLNISEQTVLNFVASKKQWIIAHSDKITAKDGCFLYLGENIPVSQMEDSTLKNYYTKNADIELTSRFNRLCIALDISPAPKLHIKPMKGKYGYYQKTSNTVCLNTSIVALPPACIDYIIVHELLHTIHFDHGKGFHSSMDRLIPNNKKLRSLISKYVIFSLMD